MASLRSPIDLSTSKRVCSSVDKNGSKFRDGLTVVSAEALNVIAQRALHFTGSDGVAIALRENGVFVCKASSGAIAPPVGTTVDQDSGLSGLCVRTGSVLTCDDAETDARVSREACRSIGIRSIAIVPIGGGAPVGLLEVFSCQTSAFDERAINLLSRLGQLVVDSSGPETRLLAERRDESPSDSVRKRRGVSRAFAIAGALVLLFLLLAGASFRKRLFLPAPPRPAVLTAPTLLQSPKAENSLAVVNDAKDMAPDRISTTGQPAIARTKVLGNGEEQYRLATVLAEGRRGVKPDLVRAYTLYVVSGLNGSKASDAAIRALTPRMSQSSISEVRFRLGQMFENGDNVRKDFVAAYFWFSVAEVAGHPRASEEKRRLENLMSSGEVLEARDRAARWLSQHSRE